MTDLRLCAGCRSPIFVFANDRNSFSYTCSIKKDIMYSRFLSIQMWCFGGKRGGARGGEWRVGWGLKVIKELP